MAKCYFCHMFPVIVNKGKKLFLTYNPIKLYRLFYIAFVLLDNGNMVWGFPVPVINLK
jgi:hypothetical protein